MFVTDSQPTIPLKLKHKTEICNCHLSRTSSLSEVSVFRNSAVKELEKREKGNVRQIYRHTDGHTEIRRPCLYSSNIRPRQFQEEKSWLHMRLRAAMTGMFLATAEFLAGLSPLSLDVKHEYNHLSKQLIFIINYKLRNSFLPSVCRSQQYFLTSVHCGSI